LFAMPAKNWISVVSDFQLHSEVAFNVWNYAYLLELWLPYP
jgi:hypothetical protein